MRWWWLAVALLVLAGIVHFSLQSTYQPATYVFAPGGKLYVYYYNRNGVLYHVELNDNVVPYVYSVFYDGAKDRMYLFGTDGSNGYFCVSHPHYADYWDCNRFDYAGGVLAVVPCSGSRFVVAVHGKDVNVFYMDGVRLKPVFGISTSSGVSGIVVPKECVFDVFSSAGVHRYSVITHTMVSSGFVSFHSGSTSDLYFKPVYLDGSLVARYVLGLYVNHYDYSECYYYLWSVDDGSYVLKYSKMAAYHFEYYVRRGPVGTVMLSSSDLNYVAVAGKGDYDHTYVLDLYQNVHGDLTDYGIYAVSNVSYKTPSYKFPYYVVVPDGYPFFRRPVAELNVNPLVAQPCQDVNISLCGSYGFQAPVKYYHIEVSSGDYNLDFNSARCWMTAEFNTQGVYAVSAYVVDENGVPSTTASADFSILSSDSSCSSGLVDSVPYSSGSSGESSSSSSSSSTSGSSSSSGSSASFGSVPSASSVSGAVSSVAQGSQSSGSGVVQPASPVGGVGSPSMYVVVAMAGLLLGYLVARGFQKR